MVLINNTRLGFPNFYIYSQLHHSSSNLKPYKHGGLHSQGGGGYAGEGRQALCRPGLQEHLCEKRALATAERDQLTMGLV